MAQRLVLHDFSTVLQLRTIALKAGDVIDDTTFPDLAALQAAGLAITPSLSGLTNTLAAIVRYDSYKSSHPLDDGHSGAHLMALLADEGALGTLN